MLVLLIKYIERHYKLNKVNSNVKYMYENYVFFKPVQYHLKSGYQEHNLVPILILICIFQIDV